MSATRALPGDPEIRRAFHAALDRLEVPGSVLECAELAERRGLGKLKINVLTAAMESRQDRNRLTKSTDYEDVNKRIAMLGGMTEKSTRVMRALQAENAQLRKENAMLRDRCAEAVALIADGRAGRTGEDALEERRRRNAKSGYVVPDLVDDVVASPRTPDATQSQPARPLFIGAAAEPDWTTLVDA